MVYIIQKSKEQEIGLGTIEIGLQNLGVSSEEVSETSTRLMKSSRVRSDLRGKPGFPTTTTAYYQTDSVAFTECYLNTVAIADKATSRRVKEDITYSTTFLEGRMSDPVKGVFNTKENMMIWITWFDSRGSSKEKPKFNKVLLMFSPKKSPS